MRRATQVAFLLGLVALLLSSAASAQCVSGTIESELLTTGPYAGLYKYTVQISWTTQQGLSHATLDCGFEACEALVCGSTWIFDDPAGAGTGGEPGNCGFDFVGEFNCNGDASIGLTDPVLKWDAVDDGCEAGNSGSATLCFYTNVAPGDGEAPVFLVKNGQNVCSGTIVGQCPQACPVPTAPSTWGHLKHKYE